MSETTTRIRWEAGAGASELGHVGTHGGWLFRIYQADNGAGTGPLVLESSLSSTLCRSSDDADDLKAQAERWLERFTASLGAVFANCNPRSSAMTGTLLTVGQLGRLNHALRREAALIFGDGTVPPAWDDAPEWQHAESARSARKLLENPGVMAEDEHDRWMRHKIADGWTWGPVRDDAAKKHPSIRPFGELPPGEQLKDLLRVGLAGALSRYVARDAAPAAAAGTETGK